MYPLNMKLPDPKIGFAVANDELEHSDLSDAGYEPKYVTDETDNQGHTVASVRAQLDALDITYSNRLGVTRLLDLLPKV